MNMDFLPLFGRIIGFLFAFAFLLILVLILAALAAWL